MHRSVLLIGKLISLCFSQGLRAIKRAFITLLIFISYLLYDGIRVNTKTDTLLFERLIIIARLPDIIIFTL